MTSELGEHAALQNWRIVAYGAVATAMILAGSILSWVTTPSVSPAERCSKACVGKMKSFIEAVPAQWSHKKVDTEFLTVKGQATQDIWVEAVPERCDCQ